MVGRFALACCQGPLHYFCDLKRDLWAEWANMFFFTVRIHLGVS